MRRLLQNSWVVAGMSLLAVGLVTWRLGGLAKLGGSGPGSTTWDIPRIVINHTKLPTKLIEGYGGTAPIRLAVERGELAGVCASWEGLRNPWAAALKKGDMKVVVQFVDKAHVGK